jgi:type I restriction enzyme, S subunit
MSEKWGQTELGKVCRIILGQSPSSDAYNQERIGLPFFQGKSEFGSRYAQVKTWCSEPLKIAESDDILISVRAPVGESNLAPEQCCIGRGLAALRADSIQLDQEFLWHYIEFKKIYLQGISQGSTFDAISGKDLIEMEIAIPPLPEQKKIAEILSGIDTAINKIATAIVKSDTALTGIFAELDLIAAAGKISTLGEIARVQNGYAFQSSVFTEDSAGIPLVRISNISGGLVDTSKSKRIPQTLAALGEYKVSRGDILIAMSGATTGKIGIYHGSSFCLLNQRVGKFVFRPGSKSIAYATQLLLSGFLESRILAKAAGGAQPNISGKGIEAIEIPFPDTAEQDKYAITIQEFLRVNAKRRILMEKYQHLKSALSSDLLSGRKRVSI